MRFDSVKQAVAWAYEYSHLCRSAKSLNYERAKNEITVSRHGYNHALRVLAVKILEMAGGYQPPAKAHETILGYYIGWVRWLSLSEKERYRVRKTTKRIRELLEGEGLI